MASQEYFYPAMAPPWAFEPSGFQDTLIQQLEAIEPKTIHDMEDTLNKYAQDIFTGLQNDPLLGNLFSQLPPPLTIKQATQLPGSISVG